MNKRLIIIDDDQELLTVLKDIFSITYDCTIFYNAADALGAIKANNTHYDCIICDMMMPIMNGIEFYEQLRIIQPALLSRVIFLTGGSYTQETDLFLNNPEIFYCEKPIQVKTIRSLVSDRIQSAK